MTALDDLAAAVPEVAALRGYNSLEWNPGLQRLQDDAITAVAEYVARLEARRCDQCFHYTTHGYVAATEPKCYCQMLPMWVDSDFCCNRWRQP